MQPLPRCAHSVYWPEGQDFPHGCSFCNPHFDDSFVKPRKNLLFVLPETGAALNENDKEFRANKHDPNYCPKCGSGFHVEEGNHWTCADCGHEWNHKRQAREKSERRKWRV